MFTKRMDAYNVPESEVINMLDKYGAKPNCSGYDLLASIVKKAIDLDRQGQQIKMMAAYAEVGQEFGVSKDAAERAIQYVVSNMKLDLPNKSNSYVIKWFAKELVLNRVKRLEMLDEMNRTSSEVNSDEPSDESSEEAQESPETNSEEPSEVHPDEPSDDVQESLEE